MENEAFSRDEIIEIARQAGLEDTDFPFDEWEPVELIAFAKLVAEAAASKEREHWKEVVEGQRRCLVVLNDIVGGEGSTTTSNILNYSRWEQRLIDAVAEEREACESIEYDLAKSPAMFATMAEYKAYKDGVQDYRTKIIARGEA